MFEGSLSIVLPVRAGGRLAAAVRASVATAAAHAADYEVIIIDLSGSAAVAAEAGRLAAAYPAVLALRPGPARGAALAEIQQVARGSAILILDTLGNSGAAALPRLLPLLPLQAVALAYRQPMPAGAPHRLAAAARRRLLACDARDPGLGIALLRGDLLRSLPALRGDTLLAARIYAAARRAGLPAAQAGVPALVAQPGGAARLQPGRLAVGLSAIVASGGLWLLRRLRPGARPPRP